MGDRNIIIYRDKILSSSETFIRSQAEGLSRFVPFYAGYHRIKNGLELEEERVLTYINKPSLFHNRYSEKYIKRLQLHYSLFRKIKQVNPVLIHAHFGPDGVLALPFAQRLGIPLLVSFHGYDITTKDEYMLKQNAFNMSYYLEKRDQLIKSGAHFIAVSEFIKSKMLNKGFPTDRIHTHYTGVNLEKLFRDNSIEREDSVLFVGRLVENKGCEFLIRAMSRVQSVFSDVPLIIIGEGPLKENLEALSRKLSVNVRFLGKQRYEEVIKWMNRAKLLSVPSIEIASGASEGFGMVFAEAQALGLPVVSFRTGGIPEAIVDGETGYLAEPRDWEELAYLISDLLTNDSKWESFSIKGMEHIKKHFDIKNQNKRLERIYEGLITPF